MLNFSTTLKNDVIDSLAIGGFDGIHIAHQKLIDALLPFGALFIVDRKSATLTPYRYRQRFTDKILINCDFESIKNYSAQEFVELLCDLFPNLKRVVVGYDFHFGKGRECSAQCLKKFFRGEVVVIDEVLCEGVSVHSSTIREFLLAGEITQAAKMLGRNYSIEGSTIQGQGIGKKELVPTINLNVENFLLPKQGVYASYSNGYKSVSFVGNRKTTDDKFAVETHILEPFEMSDTWEISFVEFIRDNKKFDNLKELKKQIQRDIKKVITIVN